MSHLKEDLRKEALRHRVMMDPRSEDPDEACAIFFEAIDTNPDQIIATYWPKDKEFDPHAILQAFLERGHTCCLPVIQKNSKELKFVAWAEGDPLEKGPYDVMQPKVEADTEFLDPGIVIVPLLAFDRYGNRLGYGGGYYDATLKALRAFKKEEGKNILAVGVGFAQQACLFKLPSEDHDEKLDWVVTPQEARKFTNE